MRFLYIIVLLLYVGNLWAQKPLIDSTVYKQWPSVSGDPKLSSDGKYVLYSVENIPLGKQTTVLQTTDGKWKRQYVGWLKDARFTADGKQLLYVQGEDSLAILTLAGNRVNYIPRVSSFSLQRNRYGEWLCYQMTGNQNSLFLWELRTNQKRIFENVKNWQFSTDSQLLGLWQLAKNDTNKLSLNLVEMPSGKLREIWKGVRLGDIILDSKNQQIAFKIGDSIWHYKLGDAKARLVPTDLLSGELKGFTFDHIDRFSKDGNHLFTYLTEDKKATFYESTAEIWSYNDITLPSERAAAFPEKSSYLAVIDLQKSHITRLQQKVTEGVYFPKSEDGIDTIALIGCAERVFEKWSTGHKITYSLVSINTGRQEALYFINKNISVQLSGSGKYVIYFDQDNYFSYEIATGKIRNLTKNLSCSWMSTFRDDLSWASPRGMNSIVWLKNDSAFLIYDKYDIWKLDPLSIKEPVNLTNGYGERNRVIFDFAMPMKETDLKQDKKFLLSAFNTENKNNGFFEVNLEGRGDPKLLFMGSYIFNTNSKYVVYDTDFQPVKSEKTDTYIVRRMSASQAPNYFSTKDFRSFIQLSHLQPEKKYNWYTSELHTWKSLDGRELQGILYKPDNFDPSKKYPLIFHYYERKSDGLNAYIRPEALCGSCNINIPTYVSAGYLVFTPDIYYEVGDPMQGTYDAIVSAASYVGNLPYINRNKLGLQGCSFGGAQTTYLITASNLFSAACSSVGWADWASVYGALVDGKSSEQVLFENGAARMGASLSAIQEQYLKNSAILKTYKVTTPVLMMNNRSDGIIPFYDATAFFTGLRRMGKRAWLLSYPKGGHGVKGKEAEDFSIRMMQFFDHYLKDKPAPVWMTRSRESSVGINQRDFEYDQEIITPGPGLLNQQEQQKIDSLTRKKAFNTIIR